MDDAHGLFPMLPTFPCASSAASDQQTGKRLDLSGKGLVAVPPDLIHLTHVQELDLGNNQLSTFPAHLSVLTELRVLYLHLNQLSRFPTEVGLLPNLHSLFL